MSNALVEVTVLLPIDLLDRTEQLLGGDHASNIRSGLELFANRLAQTKLLQFEGTMNLTIDVDELREDRD